jgi:adenylate kinase
MQFTTSAKNRYIMYNLLMDVTDKIIKIEQWLGSGSINIFGCPFAGKDTQARKIAQMLGGELIAGGDILRSHHEPAKIEKILDSGGLIPSDEYFNMVLPYLSQPKFDGKPLILSSVGRMQGEETTILKATESSNHPIKAVIFLALQEPEVWKRFNTAQTTLHDRGGRDDDNQEVIKTRLVNFAQQTMPVIEFYRQKNLLVEIDGSKTRDEVTADIIEGICNIID